MYAEDVQFLHRDTLDNLAQLQTRVQTTVEKAQHWFAENSLKINPEKSDAVLIKHKRRRIVANFDIECGRSKLSHLLR